MPAALVGGVVVFAVVLLVAIGQAMNRPRTTVESASLPQAATSDTPLGAVPALPPAVARQEVPVQRPVRFTSKPIEPSYTVASGDSLSSIAQRFNTNADALRAMNNLPDTRLRVGQRLVIP